VGGNDLCASCMDKATYSPANYVAHLRKVLDIFHAELPRTFVNMVLAFDISNVKDVDGGFVCSFLHEAKECPCGVNATQQDFLHQTLAAYQAGTVELVASGRYDTRDDFTVVVQPFMKDFKPQRMPDGSIDQSYLAPDCFHFSPKGHGNCQN
jgi:phospholipase B1